MAGVPGAGGILTHSPQLEAEDRLIKDELHCESRQQRQRQPQGDIAFHPRELHVGPGEAGVAAADLHGPGQGVRMVRMVGVDEKNL